MSLGFRGIQVNGLRDAKTKTYNSEDSLVVTHPTTNSPACGLSTAERTGSPIFHTLWSYVSVYVQKRIAAISIYTRLLDFLHHLLLCFRTIFIVFWVRASLCS
ncbi:hypothetical protein N7519_003923 [Penicillium mononematosum]|uniref:uncharacterized protein n=1 Tax=Penicillium mononematosum TaxID=268346 RepID=UPI002548C427|nr:uncharacterized protein N7519_003923 [Penicillium mononematosum]KAJ6189015.1 hypothetical protein N7519_003923 [Penicillium mononematosum]